MRQAGMGLVVAAALVAGTGLGTGGCASGTKAEQQQARLEKQRQKEAHARAKEEARQLKLQHQQVAKETDVQQAQAGVAANTEANLGPTLLTTSREVVPPQPTGYADDRYDVVGAPLIRPENRQRQFDKFNEAMAAAGASEEATLREQDFDGPALSEIGRAKIALMMEHAKSNRPVTIYVQPRPLSTTGGPGATAEARDQQELAQAQFQAQTQARLAAVQEYWRGSAYANVPLEVRDGFNPAMTTPSQRGLDAIRALNKQQDSANTRSVNLNVNNSGSSSGSSGTGGTSAGGSSGGYGGSTSGTP